MQSRTKKCLFKGSMALLLVCLMVGALFLLPPTKVKAAVETTAHITMEDSAEVRTVGFVGIRFIVNVDSTIDSGLTDVQYGTVLLPTNLLGDGELSLDTQYALKIPTTNWIKEGQQYTAVLAGGTDEDGKYTDLPESWYNRPLAARGYVTGKDSNGETVTKYTEATVVRSLGYVAAMNVEMQTEAGKTSEILQNIYQKTTFQFSVGDSVNLGAGADKTQLLYNTLPTTQEVKLVIGGIESPLTVQATVSDDTVVKFADGSLVTQTSGKTSVTLSYTPVGGKGEVTQTVAVDTTAFAGASEYSILVPAEMSNEHNDPLKVAVDTMQAQFANATGVTLPIVKEDGTETTSGKYIAVGGTKLADNIISVSNSQSNASVVKTVGNTVFLKGNTDFGTMLGVYEFLDDIVGYEYFTEGVSCVEVATQAISLPADKEYTPAFETSIAPSGHISKNDALSLAYGMKWWADEVGVINGGQIHNTFNILPPFSSESTSEAGNFSSHPKWYTYKQGFLFGSALTYTDDYGRDCPYELCFNARGDSSEYTAMVNAAVEQYTAALAADTTLNKLSLSVRDNVVWCSCSACQEETPTDAMLGFVNDVCAGIRTYLTNANDPRKDTFRMVFLAYNCVEAAPSSSMSMDSYVDVWFADSFGVYTLALDDENIAKGTTIGTNDTYTNFKAWADYIATKGTVEQFLVWTYNSNMYNFFAPYDSFDSMRGNYALFANNGVTAVYNYTHNAQSAWSGLKDYLASKLSYNANPTDEQWNAWIDAYFTATYGDAADTMREWYNAYQTYADTINAKFNIAESQKSDGNYLASIYMDVTTSEFFTKTELEKWLGYANTALSQVSSDSVAAQKIKLERLSPLYLLLEIYGDELDTLTCNDYALKFCQDARALSVEDLDLNNQIYTALEKYEKVQADYSIVVSAGDVTLDAEAIFGEGVTITSIDNGGVVTEGDTINLTTGNYTLTVTGSNGETKLVEVIVATKVITTIDEFTEIFTGATLSGGYYVLGNDIDANGATMGAANKGWSQNAGFCGGAVFDGRGYTISNFTVTGANGIFGTLGDSTVKNVNFEGVTLNGGTALLAYNAYNADIINVNVEYVSIGSTAAGLLINAQTGTGSNFQNITLNAAGLEVPNALGGKVNLTERTSDNGNGVVFENVEIIAKSVTKIGTGGDGQDVTDEITTWPTGIIFTVKEIITVEVDDELIAEDGSVTLTHDWFKYGETVEVNGTAYTVTTNGEIAVTGLNGLTLGQANSILCETESGRVNFSNVFAVTKIINTADDLDVLNASGSNVTGYYILGGDIDATAKIISNTAYSWSTGFGGTLDGRGYTIDGLTISGHGLFTRVAGGTVKNINFTNVNLNGGTLFAYLVASGINITDVDIEISALTPISGSYNGILFARQIEAANPSVIQNVTVDVVKGANVPNVFGQIKTTLLTFENVVINATTLDKLATDSTGADVTEITGVTCNLATIAEVTDEVIVELSAAGAVTFSHSSFVAGDVLTISVNGTTLTATAADGSVTFDLTNAGLVAGTKYTANVAGDSVVITYSNVFAVTKVITSAADLTALSHGNAPADAGYYILTGNVDCNGATFNSSTSWSNGFAGTLDGRGYTISNFTVSSWGIFGRVAAGTIQNITFDEVTFNGATALFGRMSAGSTVIDNVTVNVVANTATVADETGIFFGRETPAATTITNTTINIAKGVTVYKLLGNTFAPVTVSITVNVDAGAITYYYGTSTTAPTGVTVNERVAAQELTVDTFAAAEDGATTVTLTHESFTSGAAVSVTWNGVTQSVTANEGTLTLTLADFNVTALGQSQVVTETDTHILTFTEVWNVTKVLSTKADLTLLCTWTDTKNTGYYILNGDIACGWGASLNTSTIGAWSANSGFKGTFDGRGYTISQFNVGGFGLFGSIGSGAVVKNINFTSCTVDNSGVFFARLIYGGTFENITVTINQYNNTTYPQLGFFGAEGVQNSTWRNITVNANGQALGTIVGASHAASNTYENVVFNNVGSYAAYGYSDGNFYTAGTTAIAKPDGITVNLVAAEVTELTVEELQAAEDGATTVTLTHESFTSGAAVSVTWNGVTQSVTADEGTLTLTLANFGISELGHSPNVVTTTDTHILTFTEVWNVTKVITQFSELSLLSNTVNSRNTGYYILGGDVNGSWGTIQGGSTTAWNQNSGFGGTFDGRGYTIDRFSVSGYGIFGGLGQGTVKNVTFELVTLNAGASLLARTMYNSTVENVTVKLNDYKSTSGECGILVSRQTGTSSVLKDITVDANNLAIYNVLGCQFDTATTVENYVVSNAASITFYGTSDSAGTTAITKPNGLTTNVVATN